MKAHFSIFALLLICFSIKAQDSSMLLFKIDNKEAAYPRLSADGKKILYQSNASGHWQLFIMDIAENMQTPVLQDQFNNNFPDWSYDNQWIAFVSDRDGNEEIYLVKSDGSDLKRVTNHFGRDIHPYFSPDGKYLLFNSTRSNGAFDIFRYTISSGELKQLSKTYDDETCARYSPDMQHLVYLRNSELSDDVYIADTLNADPVNLSRTPNTRDGWPMFSYDNQWVYYSSFELGTFNIYKIKLNGTDKLQVTSANGAEEDARVSLSRDGQFIIFNRSRGSTIEIRKQNLKS